MATKRSRTGVRPRLSELSADMVKDEALRALQNVVNQANQIRYDAQNRNWANLAQEWKDLDLLCTLASLPIADLVRRLKALGRTPGRGRSP